LHSRCSLYVTQKRNRKTAVERNVNILEFAKILNFVIAISALVFCVFVTAYVVLAKKLNYLLRQYDKELADGIVFKSFSVKGNIPFVKFLLGNKFYKIDNVKIVQHCKITRVSAMTMQWAFNIFILSFIIKFVLEA
jgi:hypothetical protein